jgi:hypothetical protein
MSTQFVDTAHEKTTTGTEIDRTKPKDVKLYDDALPLLDALEHHAVSELNTMETPALVNPYTLILGVQLGADDLRHQVADVLLERIHDDQPMSPCMASTSQPSGRHGASARSKMRMRCSQP